MRWFSCQYVKNKKSSKQTVGLALHKDLKHWETAGQDADHLSLFSNLDMRNNAVFKKVVFFFFKFLS